MTTTAQPTLTRAAYERAREELIDLEAALHAAVDAVSASHDDGGDLSSNGGYEAAREASGQLTSRIARLQRLIADAVVIDGPADLSKVAVGVIVDVSFGPGDVERYLVGELVEAAAAPAGVEVVSPSSPLGCALVGAHVGADVSFAAPNGQVTVTVTAIAAP